MRTRLLIASIHDVGPMFASETEALFARLSGLLDTPRLAMLVVPNHWGRAPLSAAPGFCRRLRDWADQGVEMFVHGWYHKDIAGHKGLARWKAQRLTAGEGEFLGLDTAQSAQRMADGKALIEDIIGRRASGFIAPAWLYGPGARTALAHAGLPLAEDHFRVWRPETGEVVARGPVITWATRSPAREAASCAFAAVARHALRALPIARVALHPGDTQSGPVLGSIDRTIRSLLRGRRVGQYRDLFECPVLDHASALNAGPRA